MRKAGLVLGRSVPIRPRAPGPKAAVVALLMMLWALPPWVRAQGSPGRPAAAPAATAVPLAPAAAPLEAMAEPLFQAVLKDGDLAELEQACQDAAHFDRSERLRQLRDRLLVVRPIPQPLTVVLANANALLSCKAPETSLTVLDRYGPGAGAERTQWLIQVWRGASAALLHRRAAEALTRLAAGNLASLETMALPLLLREDGTLATRPALDVLAEHLQVLGENDQAARVLLAGRMPGTIAAERLARAAQLMATLPLAERDRMIEAALDQAAAVGAWGLASELLEQQRLQALSGGGDPARALARHLRLSQRIDDAYGEWLLRRQDPSQAARAQVLERRVRSPRESGGHAIPPP
ncbi:hypothetical protein [Cyanobium sp. Morenito 9A2]|uniref:hypothetical protein n=1 Tax=Cyanobium sp. Morenito 9A2 TaxID=2823718 RepID=UPI0020CCFA6B|nr:hypothetical protein [Cyanobium sp. Morenito 9A2]MCP9849085.1 hypothetical protein [Cyanobium sp. Morenito 9A2]